MATFLTWATDVLQAVDQSAAHLSDARSNKRLVAAQLSDARTNKRLVAAQLSDARTNKRLLTDSDGGIDNEYDDVSRRLGNSNWQTEADDDRRKVDDSSSPPREEFSYGGAAARWAEASNHGATYNDKGAALPMAVEPGESSVALQAGLSLRRRLDMATATASTLDGDGDGGDDDVRNGEEERARKSIMRMYGADDRRDGAAAALLDSARAPSPAMARFRAVSREVGNDRQWLQPELKKKYEEAVRKISEVEAKIFVMTNEASWLRKSAAAARTLNAQEISNMREDSLRLQHAYGQEKNAHSTTRIQLQMREASLRAENVAYTKALAVTQRQKDEKTKEALRLETRIQECMKEKEELNMELEGILSKLGDVQDEENEGKQSEGQIDGENNPDETMLLEKRKELAAWEERVAKIERELAVQQQNAARWPSSVQREKELERRLRGLTEQLIAKQAQAETLGSERGSLQLRLERANAMRRQIQQSELEAEHDLKHNKGKKGLRFFSRMRGWGHSRQPQRDDFEDDDYEEKGEKEDKLGMRGGGGGGGGGGYFVSARNRKGGRLPIRVATVVAAKVDDLSLRAGAHLQRNNLLRYFSFAYILGLHFLVFVILSFGALHRTLGTKKAN